MFTFETAFIFLELYLTSFDSFSVEMPSVLLMAAIRNVQIVSLYSFFEAVRLNIMIPGLQMT